MTILALLAMPAHAGSGPNPAKVEAMRQRREGSLRTGDVAPNPSVTSLAGEATALLATRRPDRPLVLIFGSFT